jgi:hypothetical protein
MGMGMGMGMGMVGGWMERFQESRGPVGRVERELRGES